MKNRIARGTILLFTAAGIGFAPAAGAADAGVSVHGGTLGVGLDFSYAFVDKVTGRFGFNRLTLSEDFKDDDIEYSTDLKLESIHALADWHVFGGGFRVTGGAVLNNNRFNGKANIESGDQVGDGTASGNGSLHLDVEYDELAPYLGVGWGNYARGDSPISFSVDAGILFQGKPDVQLKERGSTGISQSDLDKEERDIENELDNFEVYPVLSASLVYRF